MGKKETDKIRIAFDIDGVLCNFNAELLRRLNKKYGLDIKEKDVSFYDYIETDVLKDKFFSFFESEIRRGVFKEATPYEESQVMLSKLLKDPKYEIYFITARGTEVGIYWTADLVSKLERDTREWLSLYFPEFNQKNLIFSRQKEVSIYKNKIKLMVEDKLETANKLSSLCKSLLLTRPWNEGDTTATRITSIAEVVFWI